MSTLNPFETLAAVNVNEHVEKKGQLSYLSWAWAVDQLLRRDHAASWTYAEPVRFGETMMVACTVTAFGIARTMQLPVMDHRNRAIPNPDAFQVNTAMQRCLVKAIALHGLGLYIYAGEDLPMGESEDEPKPTPLPTPITARGAMEEEFNRMSAEEQDFIRTHAKEVERLFAAKGDVFGYVEGQNFDQEEKMALAFLLPANIRAALKKAKAEMQPPTKEAA